MHRDSGDESKKRRWRASLRMLLRPLLLLSAVALLVRVLVAAGDVDGVGPTATTRGLYARPGMSKTSLRGGTSAEWNRSGDIAQARSGVAITATTVVAAALPEAEAVAAGARQAAASPPPQLRGRMVSTAPGRGTTTAQAQLESDAKARLAREQEELEEELVREVRAESRGARDERGEREEWASSAHLHRKYDVHTKSARARARAGAHARKMKHDADEESSL